MPLPPLTPHSCGVPSPDHQGCMYSLFLTLRRPVEGGRGTCFLTLPAAPYLVALIPLSGRYLQSHLIPHLISRGADTCQAWILALELMENGYFRFQSSKGPRLHAWIAVISTGMRAGKGGTVGTSTPISRTVGTWYGRTAYGET